MRYTFPAIIPGACVVVKARLCYAFQRLFSAMLCWLWGVDSGKGVLFQGKTLLRTHGHEIVIGDRVKFISAPRCNLVGLAGPTILDTLKGGRIKIGDDSGFSSVVISSKTSVSIGNRVKVGGNSRIFDHDFHSVDPSVRHSPFDFAKCRTAPVKIDDDVFIGTNAIILKGTHIGARSIIAAGSVVFGLSIPPDSLVRGNPARIEERVRK